VIHGCYSWVRANASSWWQEISLQAWGGTNGDGNDYPYGYIYLSPEDTAAQVASGAWRGGLNLTTLAAAEEYALGYAGWYLKQAEPEDQGYIQWLTGHDSPAGLCCARPMATP
jgi:hypothetical protein